MKVTISKETGCMMVSDLDGRDGCGGKNVEREKSESREQE